MPRSFLPLGEGGNRGNVRVGRSHPVNLDLGDEVVSLRLTRVRGVPLASEALSFAAPQIKPRFNLPGSPNETGPKEYFYFAQEPSSQALAILRASHRRLLG